MEEVCEVSEFTEEGEGEPATPAPPEPRARPGPLTIDDYPVPPWYVHRLQKPRGSSKWMPYILLVLVAFIAVFMPGVFFACWWLWITGVALSIFMIIPHKYSRSRGWTLNVPFNRELFMEMNRNIEEHLVSEGILFVRKAGLPINNLGNRYMGDASATFKITPPGGAGFVVNTLFTMATPMDSDIILGKDKPVSMVTMVYIREENLRDTVRMAEVIVDILKDMKVEGYPDMAELWGLKKWK